VPASGFNPIIRSLTLSPELAEVSRARRAIAEVASEAGFSEDRVFDITVACSEAIANAIEHSPVKDEVHVEVTLRRDRLEVEVQGPGEFQAPDRLGKRETRGLGLPLMAKLSDHVALFSGPDGGTLVTLIFYLPGAQKDQGVTPPWISELLEENELVAGITRAVPVGLYVLDPELRFRWANLAYREFLEEPYRSEPLEGVFIGDTVPGDNTQALEAVRTVSRSGEAIRIPEEEHVGFARGVTYWRWEILPLREERLEPPYDVLVVISEITDAVLQRRKLESASRSYRALAENSGFALALCRTVFDAEGQAVDFEYVEVNEAHRAFTGLPPETFLGRKVTEAIPGYSRETIDLLNRVALTGEPIEQEVYEPHLARWYHLNVYSPAPGSFVVLSRDISPEKRAELEKRQTEQALAESEERSRSVMENMSEGLMLFDADRNLIYQNPASVRIHGYRADQDGSISPKELASSWEGWDEQGNPLAVDEWPISRVARGERFEDFVLRAYRAETGREFWASYNGCPTYDKDGRFVYGFIVISDLTNRKRADAELLLTHASIDVAAEMVAWFTPDGRVRYANDATCRTLGYSRDELMNMTALDFTPGFSWAQYAEHWEEVRKRKSFTLEVTHRRKDGTEYPAEVLVNYVTHEGQEYLFAHGRDVTERKRLDEGLRQREERARHLIRFAPAAIYEVDFRGPKFTDVNDFMCEFSGYSREELLAMDPLDFLDENGRALFLERIRRSLAGEVTSRDVEYRFKTKDGQARRAVLNVSPTFEDGMPVGAFVVGHDVTARTPPEIALAESQALLSSIINSTADMIWSVDPESFGLLSFNQGLRDHFSSWRGLSIEAGMRPEDLYPSDDFVQEWHGLYRRALSEGAFTTEYHVYAGTFWLQLSFNPMEREGKVFGISVFGRDITERKEAEKGRILAYERELDAGVYARSLIEASLDPLVTISPGGTITDMNEATVRITGRTREELIGTDFSSCFTDPQRARQGYQQAFAEGLVTDYPLTLRGRDGELTDVFYNASVYRDQSGQVQGVFAAARDVTALKQLEEQRHIAGKLQQALLDIPQPAEGIEFAHLYRSATREASVGGDFYDVFEVKDGRLAILIGDVSGHGVEAARVATLVKDVVHAFAHQFRRPSVILGKTNGLLMEKQVAGFVTVFLGVLDREIGVLTYVSAGHPNGLLRDENSEVEFLEAASSPLGVFPGDSWSESQVHMNKEDLLFLYTDGLFEARRNGELFGQERLRKALEAWADASPKHLPETLLAQVLAFSDGELRDDVAMLALRLVKDNGRGRAKKGWRQEKLLG
jgi:PAS domain S-box-containing protein